MLEIQRELIGAEDPAARAEERLDSVLNTVTTAFAAAEPARVIEIARMRCLPWAHMPVEARSDGGPTRAELLALLAVIAAQGAGHGTTTMAGSDRAMDADSKEPPASAACNVEMTTEPENNALPPSSQPATATSVDPSDGDAVPVEFQPLQRLVDKVLPSIELLIQLAQVRAALTHDPSDRLAPIAVKMRGAEVWMRNTSYPDRVEVTVRELFADPTVVAALNAGLGFDADTALRVLGACHQLQVDALNDRTVLWRDRMAATMQAHPNGLNAEQRNDALRDWNTFWDPETATVAVAAAQIATQTSLSVGRVEAVLTTFAFDPSEWTPKALVGAYTSGNNPLRTHPVIDVGAGRYMALHNSGCSWGLKPPDSSRLLAT
jgi:translation initiation factor IF-1